MRNPPGTSRADLPCPQSEYGSVSDRVHFHPNLIFSVGTQVVTLVDIPGASGLILHPRGTVGVIVKAPPDAEHSYRVRFPDGFEAPLKRNEVTMLAQFKEGQIGDSALALAQSDLGQRVIYRCVIGSQAYGLGGTESDVDRRGIYLAPAELHWSLYGVPEQLENDATQEAYWELQRFLILALKANPNALECLYTPLIEKATPLAEELLAMRSAFLSRLVYQTYNGYVMSQFKKMQADIRNHGQVKWKHVMHCCSRASARCGTAPCRCAWTPNATGCWRSAAGRCRGKRSRAGGSDCTMTSIARSRERSCPSGPTTNGPTRSLSRRAVGPWRRPCHDADAPSAKAG